MAQKTQTTLVDDLDLVAGATGTVVFALDGATYAIDLDDQHTAELRATLAPYVAQVASLVGRGPSEPQPPRPQPLRCLCQGQLAPPCQRKMAPRAGGRD